MKINKSARTVRLFIPSCNYRGQVIDLSDDLMHYCSRVVRLLDGSDVLIWNGSGAQFEGTLTYLSKKQAQVEVRGDTQLLDHKELSREVHIIQAIPEGDKMDWILEKCTEMGATHFHPVKAARSVAKLQGERATKRHLHWQRVVASASLQCERGRLPAVAPIGGLTETLTSWKAQNPEGSLLFFDPIARTTLKDVIDTLGRATAIGICVGPEGGWTDQELGMAQQSDAKIVNFSPRVLRTETFALACLSQLVGMLNLESEQKHE